MVLVTVTKRSPLLHENFQTFELNKHCIWGIRMCWFRSFSGIMSRRCFKASLSPLLDWPKGWTNAVWFHHKSRKCLLHSEFLKKNIPVPWHKRKSLCTATNHSPWPSKLHSQWKTYSTHCCVIRQLLCNIYWLVWACCHHMPQYNLIPDPNTKFTRAARTLSSPQATCLTSP